MKLSKIEKKTIDEAVKHGYTFRNDSHFTSFQQGNRTIKKLIDKGLLTKVDNGNGVEYQPTEDALSLKKYSII
ncbi:hypothetical protein GNZ01_07475 [Escherichia coli]|uniref:Uncharacterized protein n=2 Tax=root TaxID=1 RepID=A0AAJ3CWH9_ECOLX|nr:hypothetical protein [Escherichia coli]YP_009101893.1 hypothetical protein PBI_121Q_306 [Escherichia phage 121Q]MED6536242.1 hypothetical protein [Escherichia coli O157]QDF14125.1 hypothetical protein vBEcoMphAPEC6_gp502c [Escherichia phage vB_EcoM_phAPEC6]AIT14196.1 hypothetical protein PBI_121Q_306 [Escherichia phage 121Q]EFJ0710460.1 hypothetical protein [Escherichia coli]MDI0804291.1 hypothetical protein [Escherichia coli]